MFQRLSTKLTILYASLFGVAMLAVAGLVYAMVSDSAARSVRAELQANAAVFDRVWDLRARQLSDSADILGRDFGFREAVATQDGPTIQSALDNLRSRLQLDRAFMMTLDGDVVGLEGASGADLDLIWNALDSSERAQGILSIDDRAYQAVSAPILAPNLIGWIVFAAELNDDHLQQFEGLAAIPLEASVLSRNGDAWRATDPTLSARDLALLEPRLAETTEGPQRLRLQRGDTLVQATPLGAFAGGDNAVLVLRYPLALALRAHQPLLAAILLLGLGGIVALSFASWMLARGFTKPIAALDAAARALQNGQRTEVSVETNDEIGRLAQSFNHMSDEIARRQKHITHMALHDSDTDLPNRRALENALGGIAGDGVVIAFSVNRYQQIRAAIGYQLATRLIAQLGQRIAALAPEAIAGRLSGDTIGLVAPSLSEQQALDLAAYVSANVNGALRVDGVAVDVALCAGVTCALTPGDHTPLDRALIAVEQARVAHTDRAIFDADAYGDPARNLSLMSEMIAGINHGALSLHYQPKLDLRANAVIGVEALVRWTHPTRGRIAPDLFVTMAEQTGHIRALTEWTLIQAIADQRIMRAADFDVPVSVNLSGRLIGDDAFTAMAITLADDADARLCLEITETAAMNDPDAALRNIDRYVASGINISIDDYGAGYSSLSYLKQIRAHELKLDKSFIDALAANSREALLVRSTIDLAHGLGMKITAEGVETAATLALLRGMGCDVAQGYLIGKPQPVRDLLHSLRQPTPIARAL
jgi:EAL domain-containing protein (putative c-di-GMP-specific phosphodiesterase class I)/GGDEF domain-containing protein